MTAPIRLCGIPGCGRHGVTVPETSRIRCATHFWDNPPVPEPPEDARDVEFWREPES